MINPVIGLYQGRPVVLFPDDWAEGWMDPEIQNGEIPIYIAEAYMAKVIMPEGQRSKFPFSKLPSTGKHWHDFRLAYYSGMCACPFGYNSGTPLAPWGISEYGFSKLHPFDR